MTLGTAVTEDITEVPLSDNTTGRGTAEMAEDTEHNINENMRIAEKCSLPLMKLQSWMENPS